MAENAWRKFLDNVGECKPEDATVTTVTGMVEGAFPTPQAAAGLVEADFESLPNWDTANVQSRSLLRMAVSVAKLTVDARVRGQSSTMDRPVASPFAQQTSVQAPIISLMDQRRQARLWQMF